MGYVQPMGPFPRIGLYVVKQNTPGKIVDHYGIVDVGNVLGIEGADGVNPVVVHQTLPHVQWGYYANTSPWTTVGWIVDQEGAIGRFWVAVQEPEYNLLTNNCEHFVRFIVLGKRDSTQVWIGLASLSAAVGVAWLIGRSSAA